MLFEAQLLAVNEEEGETERETEEGGEGLDSLLWNSLHHHAYSTSDTSHATNQKHYRTHTCKELIIMQNDHTLICIMMKNKNLRQFPETDAKENRLLQMWVPFAYAKPTTTLLGCLGGC